MDGISEKTKTAYNLRVGAAFDLYKKGERTLAMNLIQEGINLDGFSLYMYAYLHIVYNIMKHRIIK